MSGNGWRRLSAIMDSGSAECVAPESIAKSVPLTETEASRQGQTYHTADGGVIKKTVNVLRDWGSVSRAIPDHRCDPTPSTQSVGSVTQETTCCSRRLEGHETGRYTWFTREHRMYLLHSWINESPTEKRCTTAR